MAKKPIGRPSTKNSGLLAELCARLAEGNSLRSVCRADDMPSIATVFRWLADDSDFQEQYARAIEARSDALAEETLDIADDASNDWMERNDPENPGWLANHEHISRSKLRVDTRKWIASKMKPRRYGDRVEQHHTGAVEVTQITRRIVDPKG